MPVYTFSRPTPAYLSDGTQVAENIPRLEPSQMVYGKAVLMEEGTTNLLVKNLGTGGIGSIIDILVSNKVWAKRITVEANNFFNFGIISVPAQPNTKYTLTYWARLVSGSVVKGTQIYIGSDSQGTFGVASLPIYAELTSEWKKFVITGQTDANATTLTRAVFRVETNTGCTVEIADWQLEAKPYPTSFTDGTRAAESLTIPTAGVLNPQEGTVEILLYVNQAIRDSSAVRRFFEHLPGPGNSNRITMQHNNTPHWFFTIGDANGNAHSLRIDDSEVADGWRLFAMKWGASEFAVYVDGVKKASISNPTYLPSAVGQNIIIRGNTNTLVDDLRISSRARSDAEILAAYQSGQPLPADEWTTLKLNFSYFESIVINSSVSGVGRKLTRQATNISSAMTMTGRATRGKRAHATANAAVSISGTARRLMRTSAAINITLGLIGRLWNAFQRIYFLLSHIEYKPDLFVEEYVINLEHVDYEIKLEVIGLAISGSTITLKATFQDSAGDLQELENVVVKIYAPGKVLLETIPATKISTGVYTADYTIPEDKEGQFDYEFSGSLGNRTIVGRSSFDSHWR